MPKFIIRNSRRTLNTQSESKRVTNEPPQSFRNTLDEQFQQGSVESMENRMCQLQGNLKLLEKRYKQNLKQGFDSKIKAYRLQAVVERRLLKQAVEQAQKYQEMQRLKQKIELNQKAKQLSEQRSSLYNHQKMEREKFIRQKNETQKKKMSLTLYQKSISTERQNRMMHNKIQEEQRHVDRKKMYFQELRKAAQRRESFTAKREMVGRMMRNTEKLRSLKKVLDTIEQYPETTFLTL